MSEVRKPQAGWHRSAPRGGGEAQRGLRLAGPTFGRTDRVHPARQPSHLKLTKRYASTKVVGLTLPESTSSYTSHRS